MTNSKQDLCISAFTHILQTTYMYYVDLDNILQSFWLSGNFDGSKENWLYKCFAPNAHSKPGGKLRQHGIWSRAYFQYINWQHALLIAIHHMSRAQNDWFANSYELGSCYKLDLILLPWKWISNISTHSFEISLFTLLWTVPDVFWKNVSCHQRLICS